MSNKIKCAVFDLDGTLVNTIDDLAGATEILLKNHNFESHWTLEDYIRFVGNGAKNLLSVRLTKRLTKKPFAKDMRSLSRFMTKSNSIMPMPMTESRNSSIFLKKRA